MLKIFEMYKNGIQNKLWVRIALVISVSLTILAHYFQNIPVYWFTIILFLILVLVINTIYKEKSWESSLLSIIPLFTIYTNFKTFYDTFSMAIIFFIMSFSALFVYQAYLWFEVVWKKNLFNIRTDWENLDFEYFIEHQFKWNYVFLYISSILHSVWAFAFFQTSGVSLGFIHQLMIFLLSFFLISRFMNKLKKILKSNYSQSEKLNDFKKNTSKLIFLTFIIYFVFDTLLEVYRIKDNGFIVTQQNIMVFFFNFMFIYIALKSGHLFNKNREMRTKK